MFELHSHNALFRKNFVAGGYICLWRNIIWNGVVHRDLLSDLSRLSCRKRDSPRIPRLRRWSLNFSEALGAASFCSLSSLSAVLFRMFYPLLVASGFEPPLNPKYRRRVIALSHLRHQLPKW